MTTFRGTYLAGIANAVEARLTDSSRFLWTLPMVRTQPPMSIVTLADENCA